VGRPRLGDLLEDLGREATATQMLDALAGEADRVGDDMAACLLAPTDGVTAGGFRTEELELAGADVEGGLADRFLAACGLSEDHCAVVAERARAEASRTGSALLRVSFGNRGPQAEVVPGNVERLRSAGGA